MAGLRQLQIIVASRQPAPGLLHAWTSTWLRRVSSSALGLPSLTTATGSASKDFLSTSPIKKVLIANRGEIACRVMATARKLGLGTVAVYSEADRLAKHVEMADEAYCIGSAAARDSYLRQERVLEVARKAGAHAIHPGYGFLSENAGFAEACEKAGIIFIGPPAPAIRAMGDKAQSKIVMSAAGVPVVPGYHGEQQDNDTLIAKSKEVGFPLLVKAVAGGGGKGMKIAMTPEELPAAIASARREAAAAVGDDRLLLERYIVRPRHVEVQVMADSHGGCVYLFDRDCSVQRRHQKVIEEAPAPDLPGEFHAMIGEAAVKAAQAVNYRNAGTVEFIVDVDAPGTSGFYFMEMNTRLQVEHCVSEAVSGVDLVEWQLVAAAGGKLPYTQQQLFHGEQVSGAGPHGHAVEARLYAESPRNNFLPGAGTVVRWRPPTNAVSFELPYAGPSGAQQQTYVRVDSGVREGDSVGINYDPMIAKIIAWAPDRPRALAALKQALADTQVAGLSTNLAYLKRLAGHPAFINLDLDTGFIKRHADTLLAPQVVPASVVALAGVARHLIQVAALTPHRPGGAWGIPDSKRLWHSLHVTYPDMNIPEANLISAKAVKTAAATAAAALKEDRTHHEGVQPADGGLQVSLTVHSVESFDVHVRGLPNPSSTSHATQQVHVHHAKLNGDRLQAEVSGCRLTADVVQYRQGHEEVLVLWMDGEQYELRWPIIEYSKDVKKASGGGVSGGEIKSPMPGRVIKVIVEEGQIVSVGTPVVVVEAMKMEHTVTSSKAGKVTQLTVAPGVQVSDGQIIMIIQDVKSPAATADAK